MVTMILILMLLASPALAAEPDADALAKARDHFGRGETLYRQAKFAEALAEFQAAARYVPRPSITLNLAQCHRNLGDPRKALFFYKLYLSEWKRQDPDRPAPYEDEVRGYIKTMEEALGRAEEVERRSKSVQAAALRVEGILVPRAQVLVDDAPMAVSPVTRPIQVAPGRREVRVEAEGHVTWRTTLMLRPGEQRVVVVTLSKTPVRRRSRLWLASTVACLALAAGMEAMGIAYNVEANRHFEDTSAYFDARDTAVAGHVTAGVMAGLAVGSFVLWLRSGRLEAPSASAFLSPAPGGGVAGWTVGF